MSPGPRPQKLLGRLVSPVVDAVDPDALLDRVDLNDLVARVDIDAARRARDERERARDASPHGTSIHR